MAPVSPHPSIHALVKSHSFECGWDLVTYFLLIECCRSDGCSSEIKLCWAVSSILHILFLSRWLSKLPCLDCPVEKHTWQGTEPQPTATKEVRPTGNWVMPTTTWWAWKQIHPKLSFQMTAVPVNTLTSASWETEKKRVQLNNARIPGPQKPWNNKCVSF